LQCIDDVLASKGRGYNPSVNQVYGIVPAFSNFSNAETSGFKEPVQTKHGT
jgi:hypothetical protein